MNEEHRREDEGRQGVSARLVALVVVVILVVLLGVDNRDSVEVGYLVDDGKIPLVWVILVSLVLGAILERLYVYVRGRRRDD